MDADTYKTAAAEHSTVAVELYQTGRFVLAHYVAGLAVECILRAYRYRIDPEFDARHDLDKLYKMARFADIVGPSQVERMSAAMELVLIQWSNNHRFRSEDALRKRFVKLGLYAGIKGDFMKELSRRIVNAAAEVVSVGVARWNH